MPVVSKQKVQKAKEVVLVRLKGKGKEKAPPETKAKMKTAEPSVEGFQRRSY